MPKAVEEEEEQPKSRCQKLKDIFADPDKLRKFLRYASCLVALGMSALGFFGFISSGVSIVMYVISFWLFIFGPLMICSELKQRHVRTYFKFLSHKTGRGLFYIFLGTFCLCIGGTTGLVGGILGLTTGGLLLFAALYLRCTQRKQIPEQEPEEVDVELAKPKDKKKTKKAAKKKQEESQSEDEEEDG